LQAKKKFQQRRGNMKKLTLSGIMALMTVFILTAWAFAQLGNPNAPLPVPGGPGMGGPGMGHGKMMDPGAAGPGMGSEMMMGHGMMSGMGQGGRMMEAEHHLMMCLAGLNLDDQQKKGIDDIKSRIMKETIRRMADIRVAQIELRDLLKQDPMDMKAVEAKVKQIGMMQIDLRLSHIKALEDLKKILTPEQRKKFMEKLMAGPLMGGMGMMHK
jgi:Spy/CpxP family protein refolding chaperone